MEGISILMQDIKEKIKFTNKKLEEVVKKYNFILVSDNLSPDKNQDIFNNFNESKTMVINQLLLDQESKGIVYIICFEETILFIQQNSLNFLNHLFKSNISIQIFFLPDAKDSMTNFNIFSNKEIISTEFLSEEISPFKFIKKKSLIQKQIIILSSTIPSLFSYLIKKCYIKSKEDRMNNYYRLKNDKKQKQIRIIKNDEYINLCSKGFGSSFKVELIYLIKEELLLIIKKDNSLDEIDKLKPREKENYMKIDYPLFPIFFGLTEEKQNIVIEYINGYTLNDIINKNNGIKMELNDDDKITIIFEIMIMIEYLHEKNLVYRDLKPNNIIINENKVAFLIDFDRMIEYNENAKDERSSDFGSPEFSESNEALFVHDIYSIGKMINYIMNENNQINKLVKSDKLDEYPELKKMYKKCIQEDCKKRPSISQLISEFFINHHQRIKKVHIVNLYDEYIKKKIEMKLGNNIKNDLKDENDLSLIMHYYTLAVNHNYSDAQYDLGDFYYDGKYVSRDINKSIHYYTLAANQNYSKAQYNLGVIYSEGKYITRDINKSIHYYTLAANQNNSKARFNLGVIYSEGKYITRDINKSIHYYTLAVNQNNSKAQFNLGIIYSEGKYITRDINKSIHYYTLAANQNNSKAQFNLGIIYSEGKYITRDINKSIHYYTLAANQNYLDAQYNLGLFYYNEKYITRDINKSIHYFTLAANKNDVKAQYYLGSIYYNGKYITRDINKSIYYFTLASDQNDLDAQYYLGVIYYEGKYIKRDINKSIHYYTLAANQNDSDAQCNLGFIYIKSEYHTRDISKSIHYFTLSANQNNPKAQYSLGLIYYEGKYTKRDISKSIYYFTLAANQNYHWAQLALGLIYLDEEFTEKNIYKGIDYLIQSSQNGNIDAHFAVGYFYHEGKYVEKDIKKSIHHYKEASTFYDQYAKNNLGIIYKHGFGDEIPQNIGFAMEYFDEAIRQKNDILSMYNLSHIYIYEDQSKEKIDESIKLLIRSSNQNFIYSEELLTIALIKKHGNDIENISKDLMSITNSNYLTLKICQMIHDQQLLDTFHFEKKYNLYRKIDFIYDFIHRKKRSSILYKKKSKKTIENNNKNMKNITADFYEGFGF